MKRPAFQFYPADWRKDVELRSCSLAARGLWVEIMCIAHECDPYGYLAVNGKPMNANQIAAQAGIGPGQCKKLLAELINNGVARQNEEGFIFSKRMVKDERLRNIRASAGRLGGNPNLLKQKDNQKSKQPDKQSPTPSSSSSTSVIDNSIELSVDGQHVDPSPPDCPHDLIIAAYHAELPMLRQVREWNSARRSLLKTRWRESKERQSVDWWREFFRYVATCPLLVGDHNSATNPNWQADLEWLIRPSNFVKVIEGKYEKKEQAHA